MADLAVVAAEVGLVDPIKALTDNMIAAATITAGQIVYRDANGRADLADASAAGTAGARGVALESVAAGEALTICQRGELEGFTIAQAYDAPIFLSDTAGALADAAGTVSVAVGNVCNSTDKDLTKLLYVDFPVGN
jgi:hypothetical protein